MATWTINGSRLEALGLQLVSGSFTTQGVSTMRLDRACDYDATEVLTYGTAVTLRRDGVTVFQGKVDSTGKGADGNGEGHGIDLVDAWADLEKTIYQETWAIGGGSALLPRAVLGIGWNSVSEEWERITAGAQIEKVLEFAIAQGVNLQVGTMVTGELLIPSEIENMTCAEVIQQCLKLHPDWIPYLDHTTIPPSFHVKAAADATPASFSVDGTGPVTTFNISYRSDMLPAAVRIVYELATTIDGEVYRHVIIDKYPADGPDSGPRTIVATIPLAGMQMQTQKSRVQVRAIPTSIGLDAENYLKKKFPQLRDVDTDHFRISVWAMSLETEADAFPDPISPQAPRLIPTTISDVPNELVRGQIEDWMRKKVGRVNVAFKVVDSPLCTPAEWDAIRSLPKEFTVVATNATTRIYSGITQFVAPEDVPTGIAEGTYKAILAAMSYQGSVTIADPEVSATSYYGRSLGLTGGESGWVTMKAPVHSVDFDVQSGTTTIGFGPHPALAPADFLELQRILRFRPVRWWTVEERGSDKFGTEAGPSAAGDTVSGFELPRSQETAPATAPQQFEVYQIMDDAGTWTAKVAAGEVLAIDPVGATVMAYNPATAATVTISATHTVYALVETDPNDLVTAVTITSANAAVSDTHAQPEPGGQNGAYYYRLADFESVGGVIQLKNQYHRGGPIIHRPGRNDRNLKIQVNHYWETTGTLAAYGSPEFAFFRQGNYVGNSDPGDSAAEDVLTASNIAGIS